MLKCIENNEHVYMKKIARFLVSKGATGKARASRVKEMQLNKTIEVEAMQYEKTGD